MPRFWGIVNHSCEAQNSTAAGRQLKAPGSFSDARAGCLSDSRPAPQKMPESNWVIPLLIATLLLIVLVLAKRPRQVGSTHLAKGGALSISSNVSWVSFELVWHRMRIAPDRGAVYCATRHRLVRKTVLETRRRWDSESLIYPWW